MRIPLLSIASCPACQNRCEHCAHQGMRNDDPGYQMGLDEIEALIDHCRRFGITADKVSLCGPGEPLLWKHFNEAARLLHGSGITGNLCTTTNGKALNCIADDVWEMLTVELSVYDYPLDQAILGKRANRIVQSPRQSFRYVDESQLPVGSMSGCCCPGVTYYKFRVYPECGPVLFDACRRAKSSHLDYSLPLYAFDPSRPVRFPKLPCGWCWANNSVPTINAPYKRL